MISRPPWSPRCAGVQVAKHDGDWGRIFKALDPGQSVPGAMQAYGVKDVAQLYSLPPGGFDFVKIDVEGAEGMIFDPETADLSWIDGTNVLSLEVSHRAVRKERYLNPKKGVRRGRVWSAGGSSAHRRRRCGALPSTTTLPLPGPSSPAEVERVVVPP